MRTPDKPRAPSIIEAPPPPVAAPPPPPPPRDDRARDVVRGPQKGGIAVPPRAGEHRVFVDGRVAGTSPGTFVIDCGPHTIKIGHDGREQSIDVPCGGRIDIPFP